MFSMREMEPDQLAAHIHGHPALPLHNCQRTFKVQNNRFRREWESYRAKCLICSTIQHQLELYDSCFSLHLASRLCPVFFGLTEPVQHGVNILDAKGHDVFFR